MKKQIPDIGGHDRMTLLKTLIKSEAAIEDITDYKCLIGSVLWSSIHMKILKSAA